MAHLRYGFLLPPFCRNDLFPFSYEIEYRGVHSQESFREIDDRSAYWTWAPFDRSFDPPVTVCGSCISRVVDPVASRPSDDLPDLLITERPSRKAVEFRCLHQDYSADREVHPHADRIRGDHYLIGPVSEELSLRYVSSFGASESDSRAELKQKFLEKCKANYQNEIFTGSTASGAHRDDIEILINGKNSRFFASQGQQRSAVLSLKLAEASVLRERMGEDPVILFDDVLSELDNDRQDYLLNELKGCQVFITCCEKSNKEQLNEGKVFYVEGGEVTELRAE